MRALFALCLTAAFVVTSTLAADARGRSSGRVYGFATSHCKSSSCYAKHPSGRWVHPLTRRKGR